MGRVQMKEQWSAPGLGVWHINHEATTSLVLQLYEKQKEPGLLFADQML